MTEQPASTLLLQELRALIESGRRQVAVTVNSELVALYWRVGQRIRTDLLREKRAAYGKRIIPRLARHLAVEYGRGFNARNLHRMVRFAETFPDEEIVTALRSQLSWTHIRELIRIEDPLKRSFYTEMVRLEQWSTRTLIKKMDGLLYERTALSKKPETLIEQELDALAASDRLTPDLVLRDPYILDFSRPPGQLRRAGPGGRDHP